MQDSSAHGVGGVASADVAVPDHERELGFYAKVLTTGSAPRWRSDLTSNDGTPVIGLGVRSPEYEALPLQWMPHLQVADVAASVTRALELGGRELIHGRNDDGESQWAVLEDPAGAAFGVIPVFVDESSAAGRNELVGHISRISLVVADVSSICEFYVQVVGWSATPAQGEGGFEMRRPDGVAVAAIRPARAETARVPSVWILHLPVGDLDESLRQVREGGGEIVQEAAGAGHAVIRDPVGLYLALEAGK